MHIQVPGRTELAGNHTDHQGGHVLAAAVNLYVRGEAVPDAGERISLVSEGFGTIETDLTRLQPECSTAGTAAALVRGAADYLRTAGYTVGGFKAELHSEIPVGAGLSSSAAFSVWVGQALNRLYNDGRIPPLQLALAAQYAENTHFGKPCGLMDQCACACGGVTEMSFAEALPQLRRIKTNPTELGYALYVVNTGGSHQELTGDYAAITAEMKQAARAFGKERLSEVTEADFLEHLPALRGNLPDRVLCRALHFFEEDRRVRQMAAVLERRDMSEYLRLMDASGRSSAELLQNQYAGAAEQGIPLALSLCRQVIGDRGAARVHGGGFAGTVQALFPEELSECFEERLSAVFGRRSCLRLSVV